MSADLKLSMSPGVCVPHTPTLLPLNLISSAPYLPIFTQNKWSSVGHLFLICGTIIVSLFLHVFICYLNVFPHSPVLNTSHLTFTWELHPPQPIMLYFGDEASLASTMPYCKILSVNLYSCQLFLKLHIDVSSVCWDPCTYLKDFGVYLPIFT